MCYLHPDGRLETYCGKTHALLDQSLKQEAQKKKERRKREKREKRERNEREEKEREREQEKERKALSEKKEREAEEAEALNFMRQLKLDYEQKAAKPSRSEPKRGDNSGSVHCLNCDNSLGPISWFHLWSHREANNQTSLNCVVASHKWRKMGIILRVHPRPSRNKTHKVHCKKCDVSVGILWTDSIYTGPKIKAASVSFKGEGYRRSVKSTVYNWHQCNFLKQVAWPNEIDESALTTDEKQQPSVSIQPLQKADDRYQRIVSQFNASWTKTDERKFELYKYYQRSEISAIYEVINPALYSRFLAKIDQKPKGNKTVKRLWHGTQQAETCTFGREDALCDSSECAVCNICKTGFDMKRAGGNYEEQRFGRGHYFAPNPSKSHDYTTPGRRRLKRGKGIMLLSPVHVGHTQIFNTSQWTKGDYQLPEKFDSVWGVPSPNNITESRLRINFPERVVYHNDSCLVNYVIFYSFETLSEAPSTTTQ